MSGYSVRPMQLADASSVAEVHVQVWRDTYPGHDVRRISGCSGRGGVRAVLAASAWPTCRPTPATWSAQRRTARIVGFGVAGPSRDDDPPVPRELYAINVLATAQGTGLADLLMLELLGDDAASLWVAEGNARARAFYARHGFVPDGTRKVREATETAEVRLVRT